MLDSDKLVLADSYLNAFENRCVWSLSGIWFTLVLSTSKKDSEENQQTGDARDISSKYRKTSTW